MKFRNCWFKSDVLELGVGYTLHIRMVLTFVFFFNMFFFIIIKVSFVLAALQAGSRGTQACINAASTVSGIIGDLDTTIMFATAGTLHAENENETFSDHRCAFQVIAFFSLLR